MRLNYCAKVLRYQLMLCGNKINLAELSEKLTGRFGVSEPDAIGAQIDNWGAMTVSPIPGECIIGEDNSLLNDYERWFPDFLEVNKQIIEACGVDDIRLFMEVFYMEGDQFNFEILSSEHIVRLSQFKVSLPISIYTLTEQKMIDWIAELRSQ